MIREIGGTNGRLSCSRILRDDTGHTVKVSTSGTVPAGSLCERQAGQPAPNITVEDLGYPDAKFLQVGPQPKLPDGKTTTNVEGTDYVLSEAGYMGTGANPEHTLSPAGKLAVIDEAMRAAGVRDTVAPRTYEALGDAYGRNYGCD